VITRGVKPSFPILILCLSSVFTAGISAQETPAPQSEASQEDLQKATQNPVSSLISVPFQNVTDMNTGTFGREENTLNIQPVVPLSLTPDSNLIVRWITPLIFQPDITQKHLGTFGLGDMNPSFFMSPAHPGALIWGIGPAFLLPTASDDNLGTGKFSIGPTAVALVQPAHWTIGALVSNLWSVAGPSDRADVNLLTLQYFLNYNLPNGWSVGSSPILTANWNASSGNVWTVPVGLNVAKVFKAGAQPMNAQAGYFYNAVRPDVPPSPKAQIRFQVSLLFPKKPKQHQSWNVPEQSNP
jgi:hypothetical protein